MKKILELLLFVLFFSISFSLYYYPSVYKLGGIEKYCNYDNTKKCQIISFILYNSSYTYENLTEFPGFPIKLTEKETIFFYKAPITISRELRAVLTLPYPSNIFTFGLARFDESLLKDVVEQLKKYGTKDFGYWGLFFDTVGDNVDDLSGFYEEMFLSGVYLEGSLNYYKSLEIKEINISFGRFFAEYKVSKRKFRNPFCLFVSEDACNYNFELRFGADVISKSIDWSDVAKLGDLIRYWILVEKQKRSFMRIGFDDFIFVFAIPTTYGIKGFYILNKKLVYDFGDGSDSVGCKEIGNSLICEVYEEKIEGYYGFRKLFVNVTDLGDKFLVYLEISPLIFLKFYNKFRYWRLFDLLSSELPKLNIKLFSFVDQVDNRYIGLRGIHKFLNISDFYVNFTLFLENTNEFLEYTKTLTSRSIPIIISVGLNNVWNIFGIEEIVDLAQGTQTIGEELAFYLLFSSHIVIANDNLVLFPKEFTILLINRSLVKFSQENTQVYIPIEGNIILEQKTTTIQSNTYYLDLYYATGLYNYGLSEDYRILFSKISDYRLKRGNVIYCQYYSSRFFLPNTILYDYITSNDNKTLFIIVDLDYPLLEKIGSRNLTIAISFSNEIEDLKKKVNFYIIGRDLITNHEFIFGGNYGAGFSAFRGFWKNESKIRYSFGEKTIIIDMFNLTLKPISLLIELSSKYPIFSNISGISVSLKEGYYTYLGTRLEGSDFDILKSFGFDEITQKIYLYFKEPPTKGGKIICVFYNITNGLDDLLVYPVIGYFYGYNVSFDFTEILEISPKEPESYEAFSIINPGDFLRTIYSKGVMVKANYLRPWNEKLVYRPEKVDFSLFFDVIYKYELLFEGNGVCEPEFGENCLTSEDCKCYDNEKCIFLEEDPDRIAEVILSGCGYNKSREIIGCVLRLNYTDECNCTAECPSDANCVNNHCCKIGSVWTKFALYIFFATEEGCYLLKGNLNVTDEGIFLNGSIEKVADEVEETIKCSNYVCNLSALFPEEYDLLSLIAYDKSLGLIENISCYVNCSKVKDIRFFLCCVPTLGAISFEKLLENTSVEPDNDPCTIDIPVELYGKTFYFHYRPEFTFKVNETHVCSNGKLMEIPELLEMKPVAVRLLALENSTTNRVWFEVNITLDEILYETYYDNCTRINVTVKLNDETLPTYAYKFAYTCNYTEFKVTLRIGLYRRLYAWDVILLNITRANVDTSSYSFDTSSFENFNGNISVIEYIYPTKEEVRDWTIMLNSLPTLRTMPR